MTHLVDDLTEVSRITRGRLELRRASVELAPVVDAALLSVAELAAQSGHKVHVEQWPQPIWLDADATRLAQMIANLLTNAVKYTPANGVIWLDVACTQHEVRISVRDSGIGIAHAHLDTVFDLFSQLPPALSLAQGGLGIGLSLVRGLAELHGGSISAHSDGVGQGSTFTLRLPLPTAACWPARAKARCWSSTTAPTRPKAWRWRSTSSAMTCARPTMARPAWRRRKPSCRA